MKSHVLHTVCCNIPGKTAGEVRNLFLLGVKGLRAALESPASCVGRHINRHCAYLSPDTDECAKDPTLCGTNADCINTAGAYECQCKSGFGGDSCQGIRGSSRPASILERHWNVHKDQLSIEVQTNPTTHATNTPRNEPHPSPLGLVDLDLHISLPLIADSKW